MLSANFYFRRGPFILGILLFHFSALGQAPRITIDAAQAGLFTHLSIAGSPQTPINLQGSFDLATWFHLASGVTGDAPLLFVHTNAEPVQAWFYRAVVGPPPPPAAHPQPMLDTNTTVATVITPEQGGRLQWTDATGVSYEFVMGPNRVYRQQAVQMTVITNFVGFPENNGSRAAVLFEPEGFQFRGPGQLTIRYPTDIRADQMMAYSADANGEGFYLLPCDSTTRQVQIPILHFSQFGTAAFPADRVPSSEAAWHSTRDAFSQAEDLVTSTIQKLNDELINHEITQEEFLKRYDKARSLALLMAYINGIFPLYEAAKTDCNLGQVVRIRLEQLTTRWEELASHHPEMDQGLFRRQLDDLTAENRCACAHRALDDCEKRPDSSNKSLSYLDGILVEAQLITGRADAQGCDLGSDEDIWARLADAACAKAWEGTITLERVVTTDTSRVTEGPLGNIDTKDQRVVRQRFEGRLTELTSEDSHTRDDGSTWHNWKMKVSGHLTAGNQQHRVTIYESDLTREVDESVSQGAKDLDADGDTVNLTLIDGQFSSLGLGAPKKKADYPVRQVQTITTTCKDNRPSCPPTRTTVSVSTASPFQGYAIKRADKELITLQEGQRRLTIVWYRQTEYPAGGTTVGGDVVVERVTVNLYRGLR